jgi:hypothetical protein
VAAGIAVALRRGDQDGARELIEAGGQVFGSAMLASEVALQARELELAALEAERDRPRANGHPAAGTHFVDGEGWPDGEL